MYYKFLSPERVTYFENELLRFTQPADLNDPFECLPQEISSEELSILLANELKQLEWIFPSISRMDFSKEVSKQNITSFYSKAKANLNDDLGIFSLSRCWKNQLMWAHYTNKYKGFCLGFDENHSFFKDEISSEGKNYKILKEVIYSNKRPEVRKSLSDNLSFEPYITKSINWSYEEEIRLLVSLNLSNKKISCSPFDLHLFKVPFLALKTITLGVNIECELKEQILKFAANKKIDVYETTISKTAFEIERKLIDLNNEVL